ncbi:ABC transporter permease [Candidatus Omnitrophota bacterium]
MLREIFRYRDLFLMLTLRDIKIRYKQSFMGFLWAIFMPMVAVFAGLLVRIAMAVVSDKAIVLSDVVTISVKVLPWTFFISAIKFSVQSLVGNRELITKIYFPREVLPFASIAACLFDFLVACLTLSVILAIAGIGISVHILLLPLLFLFLILFTSGLGLLLANFNLFYRDVKYVVETILIFGIFFTPVFYDASTFGRWEVFLLLNPIGSILESINSVVVLHKMPDIFWLWYAGISSALLFTFGLIIFHKNEPLFAENI